MAIAVVYRPPAMTVEQYAQTWSDGPPVSPPPGLIFHAGFGEGAGFSTVSVWHSRGCIRVLRCAVCEGNGGEGGAIPASRKICMFITSSQVGKVDGSER